MAHTPDLLASFTLSQEQLEKTASVLSERIKLGLAREGQEIKAIPAYLAPPPQGISGTVLVVDTGGTNIRAPINLKPDRFMLPFQPDVTANLFLQKNFLICKLLWPCNLTRKPTCP